jgi:hypothetical protein
VTAPAATARAATWEPPDLRRWLQLGLAALWVLDGVLQYQSFMFTKAFGQMLAGGADGNPALVADSVRWAAGIIERSPVTTNAAFATIQLALGLGIAWRPAVRVALAGSAAWSAAVWWFGEGLGGVLNGSASPVSGAPGAVILYALLAVLLWPAGSAPRRTRPGRDEASPAGSDGPGPDTASPAGSDGPGPDRAAPVRSDGPGPDRAAPVRSDGPGPDAAAGAGAGAFVAARPLGAAAARGLWVVLWGSLAFFSVTAASRTAQGLHDMIAGLADGEPGWLAAVDRAAAGAVAHHGLPASIALAAVLAAIAAGIFLPAPGVRVTVALAVVVSLVIWLVGQDLGEILAGNATDVNSGPLLALIALAYWPLRPRPGPPPRGRSSARPAAASVSAGSGSVPAAAGSVPAGSAFVPAASVPAGGAAVPAGASAGPEGGPGEAS